jgi:hypothetical protein
MRYLLLAVACAAASLLACRESVSPDPLGARLSVWQPGASSTLIHDGSSFVLCYPDRLVIQDSTTWRRVWDCSVSSYIPAPPLPIVDFDSSEVLVAVSLPSEDVSVDSVVQFELGARAYVSEYSSCSNFTINPVAFHMVRAPRISVQSWQTRQVHRTCS